MHVAKDPVQGTTYPHESLINKNPEIQENRTATLLSKGTRWNKSHNRVRTQRGPVKNSQPKVRDVQGGRSEESMEEGKKRRMPKDRIGIKTAEETLGLGSAV